MRLSYIISALEEFAPLDLQEQWDNSGLQVSLPPDANGECTGVLLCLDVTPEVIAEAVDRGCNLVVSHHPLIFKGLKSLTGRTPAERTVAAAIRAGVAVYSSHTALDSTRGGISFEMARMLGAEVTGVLAPAAQKRVLVRITAPRALASDLQLLALNAYLVDSDAFNVEGMPDLTAHVPLCRVETVATAARAEAFRRAVAELPSAGHISVSTLPLDGRDAEVGLGVVAVLPEAMAVEAFAALVKERFGCSMVRASAAATSAVSVRKIALCGGSGGEFIGRAAAVGAQAYVTADVRYHDMADAASCPMTILDIGHFESEVCAKNIFYSVITNKFPNFAVYNSAIEVNPVKYL